MSARLQDRRNNCKIAIADELPKWAFRLPLSWRLMELALAISAVLVEQALAACTFLRGVLLRRDAAQAAWS